MTGAGKRIFKSIYDEKTQLGLTSEEFMVMKVLAGKPMSVDELYLFFGVDQRKESKLKSAVDVLTEKKIVKLNQDGKYEVEQNV